MRESALSRLFDSVVRPSHDKRPSIETFPDFDVVRVASEIHLERLGRERGERGEPLSGSQASDDVESRVVEKVEAELKASHAVMEDELRTYAERLSSLDFEGRFAAIRQAAPACIGDFKAEVKTGLDELHGLRRDLKDAERELNSFRRKNRLERPARLQDAGWLYMKWGVLAVLFLVEAVANGQFLSIGNVGGILGGTLEAGAIAFVNILAAFLLARASRFVVHRNFALKLMGAISSVAFVSLAILTNLSVAHYRELTKTVSEGAGVLVIERIKTDPLGLTDFSSWILFGIGFLFAVVAFLDSLSMVDPYPGYEGVQKRLEAKREAYSAEVEYLLGELKAVRDQYDEEIKELNRDLSVRRGEHDVILTNRSRLIQLFEQHQSHIERSANALLSIYREANTRARSTKPPRRFTQAFKIERRSVLATSAADWDSKTLRKRIEETQEILTAEMQAIHDAFSSAVEKYRNLDDMNFEEDAPDGAQLQAA